MRPFTIAALLLGPFTATAQFANISCTDPAALTAMKGLHDPADYAASVVIDDHEQILCALRTEVNADSLHAHLEKLISFGTRHTYSDTVSTTSGIGAARRWAFGKFAQYGAQNEDRLIPAYLQFDYFNETDGCGDGPGWRNVLAVLPGSQTQDHQVVIIEAHLDTRCEDRCDPACSAEGAEDNGSGSALVIELARVLSKYTFHHTLVFMLVTGEEHGLLGSRAMTQFCVDEDIAIKGVLNNDIIGGILCGHTASPPGCDVLDEVDSLQVRLFSATATRGLAQMVALSYREKLQGEVPVPMLVSVMGMEDRIGRGSDHIPFREAGYQSIRFCAANEHGHGDPSAEGYEDRQHTSGDVLGVDTDGDAVIDSFFVDFHYLQRNAVINGMSAVLLALGPDMPTFELLDEPGGLRVQVDADPQYVAYRVGVRGSSSPPVFDALYRTDQASYLVPGLSFPGVYYVCVAGVDANGITSPFAPEQVRSNDAATPSAPIDDLPYGLDCIPIGVPEAPGFGRGMLSIVPNPFSTTAEVRLQAPPRGRSVLVVRDMEGRELARRMIDATRGTSSITYVHEHGAGVFLMQLVVDGSTVASEKFIFSE